MSTSHDRLGKTQTPQWWRWIVPMLYHHYLCPHAVTQGQDLPQRPASATSPPPALTASLFPTLQSSSTQTLLLRNAWWRCVIPNEFLVTSPPARLAEAFGRTIATSACAMVTKRQACAHPLHWASPCQPARRLRRPSSLHLRQSFLKLLNMANCVRREAHFIWIFWLGGIWLAWGDELSKDVWKKGSTIRYTGLCGVKFFSCHAVVFHGINVVPHQGVFSPLFLKEFFNFGARLYFPVFGLNVTVMLILISMSSFKRINLKDFHSRLWIIFFLSRNLFYKEAD